MTADKLVLATNGYTDNLWPGLRRSLVPLFSAIAATEPLPDAVVQSIMPTRSSLYEIGNITVYYRFDPDNRLLIGGRSVQRDVTAPPGAALSDETTPRRFGRPCATSAGPMAGAASWPTPRITIRISTSPMRSVLVCLGYNGRGVAMSSAMGPELARRVIGGSTTRRSTCRSPPSRKCPSMPCGDPA